MHRAVSLASRTIVPALDVLMQLSQSPILGTATFDSCSGSNFASRCIAADEDIAPLAGAAQPFPHMINPWAWVKASNPCCRSFSQRAAASKASEAEEEEAYHHAADQTMDTLLEDLEAVIEERELEEADLEYGQGVMTLKLGDPGTYVINKQAPNREIWMSSPISGPVRYGLSDKRWVYRRDGHILHDRLEEELGKLLDGPVLLSRPS